MGRKLLTVTDLKTVFGGDPSPQDSGDSKTPPPTRKTVCLLSIWDILLSK